MPQKKYYNPQDDVVQIKDGKRVPVQAYDMYQAMHQGPKALAKEPVNEPAKSTAPQELPLSMRFDGQYLTLIHKEGNKITEYNFPAVSGRPLPGTEDIFSYDKERQKIKNKGPIPEGNHKVPVESKRYWDNTSLWDKTKSVLGGGPFPGATSAWGKGRVDVELDPEVAKNTGRSGITIHGGKTPGSAGCIDLVKNDEAFFSKLEELKGDQKQVPLIVDYSKTPENVQWNKNAVPTRKEKEQEKEESEDH